MDWVDIFKRQWHRLLIILAGLVMMGVGAWQLGSSKDNEELELVNESSPTPSFTIKRIVVDVAGAVEHPGVYQFDNEVRLGEVVAKAGGMSKEADSEYVAKKLNLAEVIRDGQKIYLPSKGEVEMNNEMLLVNSEILGSEVVNINTASASELETLWGIGEARAQAIIDSRPYVSIEELVTKAKVPANVVEKNKDKLSW